MIVISKLPFHSYVTFHLVVPNSFHFLKYLVFPFQGMSLPVANIEESWQAAEFYNNKVRAKCYHMKTETKPKKKKKMKFMQKLDWQTASFLGMD